MSLKEKLDAISREFANQADPAILEEVKKAIAHLAKSGILDRVLEPGEMAPTFSLPDTEGNEVALADLCADGPVLLTFYRGVW